MKTSKTNRQGSGDLVLDQKTSAQSLKTNRQGYENL